MSLVEDLDYRVMERIYQWQALAADPHLDKDYRTHYKNCISKVRDELNAILGELDRAK